MNQQTKTLWWVTQSAVLAALILPATAQDAAEKTKEAPAKAEEKKPSDSDMMAMMMEMAKPGEPHKRMQELAGTGPTSANGG